MPRYYDLTPPLRRGWAGWPGDPAFAIAPALTLAADGAAVSRVTLGSHTGAHVDAPAHLFAGGATVGDLPLDALIGPAWVLEWEGEGHITAEGVSKLLGDPLTPSAFGAPPLAEGEGIRPLSLKGDRGAMRAACVHSGPLTLPSPKGGGHTPPLPLGEGRGEGAWRVLFKTRNSARGLMRGAAFDPDYVALTAEAATWLADHGARLVGIDALSVDPYDADELPAHRALLAAGVVIVEGLDLAGVPPGRYTLCALPLALADADGAPARVVVW